MASLFMEALITPSTASSPTTPGTVASPTPTISPALVHHPPSTVGSPSPAMSPAPLYHPPSAVGSPTPTMSPAPLRHPLPAVESPAPATSTAECSEQTISPPPATEPSQISESPHEQVPVLEIEVEEIQQDVNHLNDMDTECDYDYENDPICQVMDLLNFTVTPRKPTSIFDTPLPPGDVVPKRQHLEERQALHEVIKTQRKELIKAQVEKLDEVIKLQGAEKKMHQVVKIIAELHNLYGEFVKSLVALMTKTVVKNNQVLLTIGPFPSFQEVDTLLGMLSSLSNQFESNFENLSQTKRALKEVNSYLSEKTKSVLSSSNQSYAPMETLVETVSGLERSVSVEGSLCSEATTLVIPEDEFAPLGNESAGDSIFTSSVNINASLNSTAPLEVDLVDDNDDKDDTSAFIPVPISRRKQALADGKTMYSLVEYPKQLNLLSKKHGFDTTKSGWNCICGQGFASVSLIKYHVRYFSAKWKFLCKLCSRKYPGLNFLKLHMLRSHKIMYVGTNGCNYCSKNFQTASELLTHLKIAHQKTLPSDVDLLTSSTFVASSQSGDINSFEAIPSTSASASSSTTSSSNSVLVVNGTRCACGTEAGTRDGLIAHIRSEVEAHGQHFTCSVCQNTFNHSCNLKRHFRENHGMEYQDYQERQYGCSSCDLMFESYEDLESHTVSMHQIKVNEEDPLLDSDPLSIIEFDEGAAGPSTDNTITFHVSTDDVEDGAGAPEPVVVTIDDSD